MNSKHSMPFGAELSADGTARFRLWAPAAETVDLCIEAPAQMTLQMERTEDGWFEAVTNAAAAGALYRFRLDNDLRVPDPASRHQPQDAHGPSELIDPRAWQWTDESWRGRRWEEAVLYELHVGTFSEQGTFAGVEAKLDHLADTGITAIELMPLSDFPGRRNWGYDGVLPFAPDASYGRPEDLKRLIQAAHARGLMVFVDVVYNHFGPDGNYLYAYAQPFFTSRHVTPWGKAINFDGDHSRVVRDFVIHNALYWIEEFHVDGLRLDAVHAIFDDSSPDILVELAERVAAGPGQLREVHLILENDRNEARYLERREDGLAQWYAAQWNDDLHHAMHVSVTGESSGYYEDYADAPVRHLGRCLSEGFAYQGDPSPHRGGRRRGERSAQLPPSAFVSFIQNHDQIGNRALGERLSVLADRAGLEALTAMLLLAPQPPLLFMGQEWNTDTPFLYFCDFHDELARAVTAGRRQEFASFPQFTDPVERERIPDPNAEATFASSRLRWKELDEPEHRDWLSFTRELLELRQREIVPLLRNAPHVSARYDLLGERGLRVEWGFGSARLWLVANLGREVLAAAPSPGRIVFRLRQGTGDAGSLGPWDVTLGMDASKDGSHAAG